MNETSVPTDREEARRKLWGLMHPVRGYAEILFNNRRDLAATWKKSKETAEALKDMKAQEYLNALEPKARSISKLFAYLGLVESLGVTLMDMALMLLIANGMDMHTRLGKGGMKHVSTLKELRKLDLSYKLEFLNASGLGFLTKVINRQLRNEIAHLKFKIEQNGEIKGSDERNIDIGNVLTDFWQKVREIISIFEEIKFLDWVEKGGIESERTSESKKE
jgi:hypothetical protein